MTTTSTPCDLRLFRRAGTAWREGVRPWLEEGRGRLARRHVVVPTRGQAHGLKQRCLVEGVPLLGVEFLTPSLARQKWRVLAGTERPAMREELLVFGLRILVEARLAGLSSEDAAWGFWKSLLSDPERALREYDTLLRAGFGAEHFPLPQLREVFSALDAWVDSSGAALAPRQAIEAALQPAPVGAEPAGEATLIYGFTAEYWPDFFDLAAFARRGGSLTVLLPEPELRGDRALDEGWIEMWEALLGTEAVILDPSESASCAGVAALWTGGDADPDGARVLVGQSRSDEMALLVGALEDLVASGAENVAVIFPRADAAHQRLMRLLAARGLPFASLLPAAAPPSPDDRLLRGLLALYARDVRLDELLELWPLLRARNFAREPLRAARDVCERIFDERQTHSLATCRSALANADDPTWREVGRVADLLLPPWPELLTLAEALDRFGAVCARFDLSLPASWAALAPLAASETRSLPARTVASVLESLLPIRSPVADAPERGGFAHITLTTRRRAAGLEWSHVVLAESNTGVWPERIESSCWLPDDKRQKLNAGRRFSLGLYTADDRRSLARQAYAAIAGDTREQVLFTAALFEEEEPDLRLAPNAWLERILLTQPPPGDQPVDMDKVFAHAARVRVEAPDGPGPAEWFEVWKRRRDPAAPFDEFFLSGPPAVTRPPHLAAGLIERGVEDPAALWFEAVLGIRRLEWRPLTRARKKSLGQWAHRLLAQALAGTPWERGFRRKPAPGETRTRLGELLAELRSQWPADRYWDSFHGELAETARRLLEKVEALDTGPWLAVEMPLPAGATVPLEQAGLLPVRGRMDLAFLDHPEWEGAMVDIVDFKTGTQGRMSAARMARGASLQLGIYLAAVQSLGARSGRVWMLKPGPGPGDALEMDELPVALAALERIGAHLATGRYGALTPDRTEFSHGFEWPLACTPVRHAVLIRKFAVTFGALAAREKESDV